MCLFGAPRDEIFVPQTSHLSSWILVISQCLDDFVGLNKRVEPAALGSYSGVETTDESLEGVVEHLVCTAVHSEHLG